MWVEVTSSRYTTLTASNKLFASLQGICLRAAARDCSRESNKITSTLSIPTNTSQITRILWTSLGNQYRSLTGSSKYRPWTIWIRQLNLQILTRSRRLRQRKQLFLIRFHSRHLKRTLRLLKTMWWTDHLWDTVKVQKSIPRTWSHSQLIWGCCKMEWWKCKVKESTYNHFGQWVHITQAQNKRPSPSWAGRSQDRVWTCPWRSNRFPLAQRSSRSVLEIMPKISLIRTSSRCTSKITWHSETIIKSWISMMISYAKSW